MSWDKNVYYDPQKFGLEIVDTLEANLSYEFDMFVVWKDERNKLYWASDTGCSCPTPFDSYDLSTLNRGSRTAAVKAAREWATQNSSFGQHFDVAGLERKLKAVTSGQ